MSKNIIIINPTKHLGNLLITLGVIQKGCDEIVKQGDHVSVLLDEGYKELFEGTIQSGAIYYYPRKALASGNPIRRAYPNRSCDHKMLVRLGRITCLHS